MADQIPNIAMTSCEIVPILFVVPVLDRQVRSECQSMNLILPHLGTTIHVSSERSGIDARNTRCEIHGNQPKFRPQICPRDSTI